MKSNPSPKGQSLAFLVLYTQRCTRENFLGVHSVCSVSHSLKKGHGKVPQEKGTFSVWRHAKRAHLSALGHIKRALNRQRIKTVNH